MSRSEPLIRNFLLVFLNDLNVILFSLEVSANTALLLTKKYICNITENRWEGFDAFIKIISYFDITVNGQITGI